MHPAESKPIRVLLVDDHQLLTGSLSALLAREADIEVVGVAGTVADAKSMARERLDVVLMDYRLPDGTGAEATRAIKARWPACRVVMVTALTDDETVLESIQAGADGSLTKDRAADDVVSAVRAAYGGETLLPRSVIIEIARRPAAASATGGPGSSAGFWRRTNQRRSESRRSVFRKAPQRGQRRSSEKSASSGAT